LTRWRSFSRHLDLYYTNVLLSEKRQKSSLFVLSLLNDCFLVHFFLKYEKNIWSESESFFSLYRFKLFIH